VADQVAAVAVVSEPQTFNKGLVFVKDADILLSGDKWTIIINIALDDYTALVQDMRLTLNQIWHKIQLHKNPNSYFDIHWGEVSRLEIMVDELNNDLQHFRKLLFEETKDQSFTTPNFRRK